MLGRLHSEEEKLRLGLGKRCTGGLLVGVEPILQQRDVRLVGCDWGGVVGKSHHLEGVAIWEVVAQNVVVLDDCLKKGFQTQDEESWREAVALADTTV